METHEIEQPEKPRKGRRRILLTAVLALLAAAAAVLLWQKNNIEAILQFGQYSQAELEEQLADNDKQVQDILNAALEAAQKVDSAARPEQDVPPEGREPERTEEAPPVQTAPDPMQPADPAPLPKPQTPAQPPEPQQPQTPEAPPTEELEEPEEAPPAGPTYESQLKIIVDKVYALREEYLRALDDLLAEAKEDYLALPQSKRSGKYIIDFVSTYISRGTALEKECDGKMDALAKELSDLQKRYGQSQELVDAVKYTYANEKSLKKAWYMSELERRGLLK